MEESKRKKLYEKGKDGKTNVSGIMKSFKEDREKRKKAGLIDKKNPFKNNENPTPNGKDKTVDSISRKLKERRVKSRLKRPVDAEVAMSVTPNQKASYPQMSDSPQQEAIPSTPTQRSYNPSLGEPRAVDTNTRSTASEPSFYDKNRDWIVAGATPLLMGLLMGNTGDALEVASKGIMDVENRKREDELYRRKQASKGVSLVKTVGEKGEPVYTPSSQAIGKQAYEKGSSSAGFHLKDKMELEKFKADLKKEADGGVDGKHLTKDQINAKLKLFTRWQTDGITKDSKKLASSFAKIRNARDTPASNMGMIFNYMRMLDPSSTVRESEYRTAGRAGELPDIVQGWFNTVVKGKKLTPNQRRDFMQASKDIYDKQTIMQRNLDDSIIRLAGEYGLPNPESVVSKYSKGLGLEAPIVKKSEGSLTIEEKLKANRKRQEELKKKMGL